MFAEPNCMRTNSVFGMVLKWIQINFKFMVNVKQHIVAREKLCF